MDHTAAACKDVLTCPICMDSFTTPKILTCGHSVCLTPCLAEIVKEPDPVCPLCRSLIVFPQSRKIEDMITNFSLRSLIEALGKTYHSDETSSGISCHTEEHVGENPSKVKRSSTAEACKDVLTCPICMDTFTTPKILTCGHSLCLTPCLAEVAKQPDPECPLCRALIDFPPSGRIKDMITNFTVKSLLETLEKTHHTDKTSSDIPYHTLEYGDYICLACTQQICSCCQLSFHIDANHDCLSVSDFKEKLGQDVSKMNREVNESRWSEQTKRYTTASSDFLVYINLQEKITNACKEILKLGREKKLDLRNIKQMRKQVRKDHAKLKAAWKTIEVKIKDGMGKQLAEYRKKLSGFKFPEHIYRKGFLTLEISSFENLKLETETNTENLTKQIHTESFRVLEMEEQLQNIGSTVEKAEKAVKDITREYHKTLLLEMGLTDVVEPHHLFRIQEVVEVMKFGSSRHSKDIMLKCSELKKKFQESKSFVKTSCRYLLEKFCSRPFQLTEADGRVEKTLEGVDNCKLYYEDIYEVIGEQFILYDSTSLKQYVQNQFMEKNTSYILQSTRKGKASLVEKHLAMFESFKHTTGRECKILNKYLSEQSQAHNTSVAHRKFKAIEMRLAETEYRYRLLTLLLTKEKRCYEIAEELDMVLWNKQAMTEKLRECNNHNKEVQKQWKLIAEREVTTISYDVHLTTIVCKRMEQRMQSVIAILIPSKMELKVLVGRVSRLRRVMELRALLHKEMLEISKEMSNTFNRHERELKKLDLLSEVTSKTTVDCFKNYSLQKLLHLLSQADAFDKLFKEISTIFARECFRGGQIASLKTTALLNCASSRLSSEMSVQNWKLLSDENMNHWKKVVQISKNENFDINVLCGHFYKAVSWHNQAITASDKIIFDSIFPYLKKIFLTLLMFFVMFVVTFVIMFFLFQYQLLITELVPYLLLALLVSLCKLFLSFITGNVNFQ